MTTLTVGPGFAYPTIAAAMAAASPGDRIVLGAGYSHETATVTQDGVTIEGGSASSGIVLELGAGVSGVHLDGTAPINVIDNGTGGTITGNAGDNVITVTGGNDHADGGLGNDRLVVDYHTVTTSVIGTSTTGFSAAGNGSVTVGPLGFENFTILAGSGDNTITTGAGDDRITATGHGANTIVSGDGNNYVHTGGGADTITTLGGNDTINAGEGANTITGLGGAKVIATGAGADTITLTGGSSRIDAGDGANTITATAGNNEIHTGSGADTITVTGGNNEICAGDGVNTITATGGTNEICTGKDADTITVTSGNNTIHAGDGVNTITATSGDNIIIGGNDADTITTTSGSNYIDAGNGVNTVFTTSGDDTVISGTGTDTIDTGAGNDVIYVKGGIDGVAGGAGQDTLVVDYSAATTDVSSGLLAGTEAAGYAGTVTEGASGTVTFAGIENFFIATGSGNDHVTTGDGNDTIDTGSGNDHVHAGAGNDLIHGGFGDTVDGGDGNDTLNINGIGRHETVYDPLNGQNGTIYGLDDQGNRTGHTLDFTNIEHIVDVPPVHPTDVIVDVPDVDCTVHIVACFTPGTQIVTPRGQKSIESLEKGDFVLTRDNGFKPIVWIASQQISGQTLVENDSLQPILIRRGALGDDAPNRDMMVSPQHRMLLTRARAEYLFGAHEVLVKAKHLVSLPGIEAVKLPAVTYVHLMFDQHEIILADGAWSESFQPGDSTLSGLDADQRDELEIIFPALSVPRRFARYDAARLTLKPHEALVFLAA